MRNAFILLFCAALFILSGCGAGTSPVDTNADRQSFSLNVWEDSFAAGGNADFDMWVDSDAAGATVRVNVIEATNLRALYFDVKYDATRFTPVGVELTDDIAPRERRLELADMAEAGTVYSGQIAQLAAVPEGFTGNGTLALVHFRRGAFEGVRRGSIAPQGDQSETVLTYDEGTTSLNWHYYSHGDYNQDGLVSINDLTPLGANLGDAVTGAPNSALAVVDGNNDGLITINDLTPIGGNFNRQVEGYRVFASDDLGDVPEDNSAASTVAHFDEVLLSEALGNKAIERLRFSVTLGTPDPTLHYWVRPFDDGGASEGTPSNTVQPPGGGGNNPPVIGSITANPTTVPAGGQSAISSTVADADGDTLNYVWSTDIGEIQGTGANVTFRATGIATDSTATITLVVDDGNGGSDTDTVTVDVTVTPGNNPPEINLFIIPPSVESGASAPVFATASDPDSDPVNFTWSAPQGDFDNPNTGSTNYNAPVVAVDTVVAITLDVDDGQGGTDQMVQNITVTAPSGGAVLDRIELDPSESFNGSGTQADPYQIPFGTSEILFRAFDTDNNEITMTATWNETSPAPGTAFGNPGQLWVDAFESNSFEVSATKDAVTSNILYFTPGPPI